MKFTQFKYKKPKKIHHSNFNILIEREFFCSGGCGDLHDKGYLKIKLPCIKYIIKHNLQNMSITYIGCMEQLVEYIIYSSVGNLYINRNDKQNSSTDVNCEEEKNKDNMNISNNICKPVKYNAINCAISDFDTSEDNLIEHDEYDDDEFDDFDSIIDNDSDEGYISSSLESEDILWNTNFCYIINQSNFISSPNNNIKIFPKFLTDYNIDLRQSILNNILDEDSIDYLDCGVFESLYDSGSDNVDCNWRMCYFHKLNLNSLNIIHALLTEEMINNYRIKYLNKTK